MKSLHTVTTMTSLSMRVQPRGSDSSPKSGRSLRRRGFTSPRIFFHKTIMNKGWRALCQPPTPAATMVVQEFYANLASHMNKKVRVRGVWADFYVKSINEFYNLEPVDTGAFDSLYAASNYPDILRVLTNGKWEWKLNSEGHAINF